jgi:hypothetical protein
MAGIPVAAPDLMPRLSSPFAYEKLSHVNDEAVLEAERREPATAHPVRNFLIIAIALFVLKLLMVSHREMVPEPYDAEGYVNASLDNLGGMFAGGYEGHPPGASLIMALARSLGIPYRVFIEGFLAAAAFLFFLPQVVWTRLGIAAGSLVYAILLFHPNLILGLDRSMSDPVSFACLLAGAGGIIGFVAAPREKPSWWSLGLAAASFAFVGITRSAEGAIVVAEMVAVALLSILLFRGVDRWRRRRAVVACLCAVVANLAATQALSAWHFVKSGYWGATVIESREWHELNSILLSLPIPRSNRHFLANRAALEMAESFSADLRDMKDCFREMQGRDPDADLSNDATMWLIVGCLPEEGSARDKYGRLRAMSADILRGARERGLQLSPPVLGLIAQPATKWLSDLPSSIIRVATDAVQIPSSTRVDQNVWREDLFNDALLRRTALAAASENPELAGYHPFIRTLYASLATLFWPSAPLVVLALAFIALRPSWVAANLGLEAFALSFMTIDVLCRISFYSIVDWIMWDLQPRYVLGASVLMAVIVSTLLTVWLPPAVGHMLGPKLTRHPGLWFWPKITGISAVARDLKSPH